MMAACHSHFSWRQLLRTSGRVDPYTSYDSVSSQASVETADEIVEARQPMLAAGRLLWGETRMRTAVLATLGLAVLGALTLHSSRHFAATASWAWPSLLAEAKSCPVFDSQYCQNFQKSDQFHAPDAETCRQKCFEDDDCTGGYFFDTEKTCYHFGTASAQDGFCGPYIDANPDVHRFDCTQAVPDNMATDSTPVEPNIDFTMCAGVTEVLGHGAVSVISAKWNTPHDAAGKVNVFDGGVVAPAMKGRAYFAAGDCIGNDLSTVRYSAIPLLGRTLRYSVDLSAVECGCNAALYLTMMAENNDEGLCEDRYCDASNICGVKCDEIDIQEANKHAWYSTLHAWDDPDGVGGGYGATRQEWNASAYGPGAQCIDTNFPFQVAVSFPIMQPQGLLKATEISLSQIGKSCPLTSSITHYTLPMKDGMGELSASLQRGVTPIISYWGIGEDMSWVDGGEQGVGPACVDAPEACGDTVKFWGFAVE